MSGGLYVFHGPVLGSIELEDADGIFAGEDAYSLAASMTAFGDIDGDGLQDALAWGTHSPHTPYDPGSVFVVPGPATGARSLDESETIVQGQLYFQHLGMGISTDDLDGDGQADLTLGAPIESLTYPTVGGAYIFYGPLGGVYLSEDADAEYHGNHYQSEMGTAVLGADSDGDGNLELWISTPGRGALESLLIYALD